MMLLLVFGVTLIGATLLSAVIQRSVLSTAVLFTAVGFAIGPGVAAVVPHPPGDAMTSTLAELALFAVLFTDGVEAHLPRDKRSLLRPSRVLFLGLPVTMGLNALLCHWVAGMPWLTSGLAAICLGPTDPVLAGAIVGRESVPARVRSLLNLESGVNDGLTFPFLAALLAFGSGGPSHPGVLAAELLGGIAIGVAVSVSVVALCRVPLLEVTDPYRPLLGFGAAVTVFALAKAVHANEYLAAFAAGITVAVRAGDLREDFTRLNGMVAEALKLAALLLFGLLMQPGLFTEMSWRGYVAALLILVAVRPVALALALVGSGLSWREWVTVAWFGPKGFASVVYGLLVLHSGVSGANAAASLVGLVVMMSIVAHSSTDVLIARWLERNEVPGER
jgi:NhaP-type Na+/H+ or K+/H+ antiporter